MPEDEESEDAEGEESELTAEVEDLRGKNKDLDEKVKEMTDKSEGRTRAFLGIFMLLTVLFLFFYTNHMQELADTSSDPIIDTDNDGISDDRETEMAGTDPYHKDTDADTVDDYTEIYKDLTDPTSAANQPIGHLDYDEDGVTNEDELVAGTDPLFDDSGNVSSEMTVVGDIYFNDTDDMSNVTNTS